MVYCIGNCIVRNALVSDCPRYYVSNGQEVRDKRTCHGEIFKAQAFEVILVIHRDTSNGETVYVRYTEVG